MSDERERRVKGRLDAAFDPRPPEELERGVRDRVERPHTVRRARWGRPLIALLAAALAVVAAAVGFHWLSSATQPTVASKDAVLRQMVPPQSQGSDSFVAPGTALRGTRVSALAQAQSLADPAVRLPAVSVTGPANEIVVWSLAHPGERVTNALSAQERSQVAVGVLYSSGVELVTTPLHDSSIEDRQTSRWRDLASRPASEATCPFLDGRSHAGALITIAGRRTFVEQAGVARRPGHPGSRTAVPSTVSWIENGVLYQLSHPTLPVSALARIAAAVP